LLRARGPNARVGTEIPLLADYYAKRAGREDLTLQANFLPLTTSTNSSPEIFLIDARGRTYFSNQAMLERLRQKTKPAFTVFVGNTPAADIYVLDEAALASLRGGTPMLRPTVTVRR
jgi:hypothetical protein